MTLRMTPRARAVARYLLGGWNTESIARELRIDPRTIRKHYYAAIVSETRQPTIARAVISILRDAEALSYVMEVR